MFISPPLMRLADFQKENQYVKAGMFIFPPLMRLADFQKELRTENKSSKPVS